MTGPGGGEPCKRCDDWEGKKPLVWPNHFEETTKLRYTIVANEVFEIRQLIGQLHQLFQGIVTPQFAMGTYAFLFVAITNCNPPPLTPPPLEVTLK